MKGIVIYYSATGNTKKIAGAIHRGMKKVLGNCDLSSISEISPQDMGKYDVVGIGAPIWYFREPANVRLFIYNMPDMNGKLCFPFCSHGTAPFGIFFSMVPALQKKGLSIIGYNDWYGSVYQVLHAAKPYFTDGHPDEIDLQEAEAFGREMAERARRITAGEKDLIPSLPKGASADTTFQPHPLGQPFPENGKKADVTKGGPPPRPERTINMAKCLYPQCTICVDNCPAHSIDFSSSPPVIKKSCFNDFLCDRLCPTGAIGIPEEQMARNRTMKVIDMQKCKYPECTVCIDHCPMHSIDFSQNPPVFKKNCEGDDLCWVICPEGAIEITNMDVTHEAMFKMGMNSPDHPFLKYMLEAEARGKFRRLVPLDKIGWDNPVYKMKNHPRFDINKLLK
ncbi:MAG TPA: flavodoxin domain-containing protein [Dehalococcoidia bacterium]|nr:flavodoxin domain-containing protein [Dehalococcoidia bacterium]